MQMHRRSLAAMAVGLALVGFGGATSPAWAQGRGLEIVVPANPGGGWDQTGRAMQTVLGESGLASGAQVQNIGGAGGTIGLAQFSTGKKGRGNAVLVGGLVMVGAILTNNSPVSLANVTPLARLTGEYEVLVVPAASPIKSLADLVAKLKAEPASVSWGGGSAGGTDHIVAGLIAQAVGVDPTKVNYIAHAGGGEALSSILGGHVTVGVSGYQEFASQIAAGQLRGIGVTAEEAVPGIDIPTLKAQGVDVALVNWRGIFAAQGIKKNDLQALNEMVGKMVKTPQWQDVLQKRGWLDMYQPADAFAAFVKSDAAQVETTLRGLGMVK